LRDSITVSYNLYWLALNYSQVHYQYIIHRDIKPANLLLDANNNVKISDLGVSVEVEDSYLISGQVGTPAFMSPELLNPEKAETVAPSIVREHD